jgi:hypothetical protein
MSGDYPAVVLSRKTRRDIGDDRHGEQSSREPKPLVPLCAGLVHLPLALSQIISTLSR